MKVYSQENATKVHDKMPKTTTMNSKTQDGKPVSAAQLSKDDAQTPECESKEQIFLSQPKTQIMLTSLDSPQFGQDGSMP